MRPLGYHDPCAISRLLSRQSCPSDDLTTLLEQLGVSYSVSREAEGGATQGRAAEYRPARDASVLGRLLTLLGAPVGAKNTTASIELPAYLNDAPDSIREEFVAVYLRNRGTWHQDSRIIKFREERSKSYLRTLANLIESVAGAPVSVSEYNINLSVAATRAIGEGE